MPSPFPGVDPYLEAQGLWPEFHSKFINCWHEALLGVLPDEYDARMDERVYLVDLSGERPARPVRPDVAVEWKGEAAWSATSVREPAVATLEPVTIPLSGVVQVRESYLRVLHREDRSLVGILEALSPANKGSDRAVYLAKRNDIVAHETHLVGLDLLLGGQRMPMERPLPPAHYYAIVSRAEQRPDCQVYSWTVRDALPKIPIPLKAPDPDVTVDLEEVFRTAYERGRYERAIDYSVRPELPLDDKHREWVAEQPSRSAAARPGRVPRRTGDANQ